MKDERDAVRLGVSACLLGAAVRYDGGHKHDPFLTGTLGRFVEWVPVCPEEEAGLGTPREAMRLVRDDSGVRLLTVSTRRDVTEQVRRTATARVERLVSADLDGYILKKDSPSCGLERVKIYGPSGPAERSGRGLFAEALCARLPLLPVEEEGRLNDPRLRENFIVRVFAHRRLRALRRQPRVTRGDLVAFHTRHKLLLLAHRPASYTALGRVVGGRGTPDLDAYGAAFMSALSIPASRGRHANVLAHMAGYFRRVLDEETRRELAETVADYQRGFVPLVVPLTLIAHYARRCGVSYLLDQVYLQPHPRELMLLNHV